jgi:hypothetical protein
MKARKFLASFAALFIAAFVLTGAACQKVEKANPIAAGCKEDLANNLAVCGYATYGTFVIFEELAASVAKEPSVSASVRQGIIKADEVAKPVVDNLYASLKIYEDVRTQVAAGESTTDKLDVAAANLNRWITEAAPLVANLVNVVNDAKRGK